MKQKMTITLWLTAGVIIALSSTSMFAAPIVTTLQISVDPVATPLGGAATVAVTLTPNSGEINCGKGHIQYRITSGGVVGDWTALENNIAVVSNQFDAQFDTNAVSLLVGDLVDFRAGYQSSGQGCNFQTDAIGQSPTTTLLIVGAGAAVCPDNQVTGVFISIQNPQGNGMPAPGQSGPWSLDVDVLACENVYKVSAQGGANGWAPIKSYSPASSTVQQFEKNRNTVYLWTIGDLSQGQHATLTIVVDGSIKNKASECGKEKVLNGDWSALYSTTPTGVLNKSAYTTTKSTILVTCQ